jgi:hypothetical protein
LEIGCGPWLQREVAAADWLKGRLFPVSTSWTKRHDRERESFEII